VQNHLFISQSNDMFNK